MSLVYAALFLAGFANVGVLVGGLVLSRLGTRINAMDEDAHDAFGYVGDHIGELIVRVNRFEEALAEDPEDEVDYVEDVEDENVDQFFIVDKRDATFYPLGDF